MSPTATVRPATSKRSGAAPAARIARRFRALLLPLVLIAGGCGSPAAPQAESVSAAPPNGSVQSTPSAPPESGTSPRGLVPQSIRDRGYVTVATTFGLPPEQFYDEHSKPVGSTMDIGSELAAILGIEFRQVDAPWDAVIAGLQARRYDVVIGGMNILPERRKLLNFVLYKHTGKGMIIHSDDAATLQQWSDFCGKRVGNVKGSNNGDLVIEQSKKNCESKGLPAIQLVPFNGASDVYQAITAKRIEGSLNGIAAVTYMADHSGGTMKVVPGMVTLEGDSGIATIADDNGLGKAIAAALQQLMDNGTYATTLTKWGIAGGQLVDKAEYMPAGQG